MKFLIAIVDDHANSPLQDTSSKQEVTIVRRNIDTFEVVESAAWEALKLACADAWPDNPHWPEMYLQKARSNIQVRSAR